MPYYPLSQIKPSLYTNGEEYVLSTTQENYIGYYYELSNGKRYTGKTPQDGLNILLLPNLSLPLNLVQETAGEVIEPFNILTPDVDNPSLYSPLDKKILGGLSNRFVPLYNATQPTQQDYNVGVFTRYFCKRRNQNTYIEIDQKTYNLLKQKSKNIAWDLYAPIQMLWYLTGSEMTVAKANKGLVMNLETTQKWYGFSQYFKNDFTQYHKFLDISNLYTSGSEFKTKNGQEYIGFYHIHNGNIPMVGKTHITEFHETLIPISQSLSLTPINQTSSMSPTTISPTLISGGSFGGGGGY